MGSWELAPETRVFRQVIMSEYMEKDFEASIDRLPEVLDFVEEEMNKAGCPMKVIMQVNIALEEIFVNVAHYAYPDGVGPARVGIEAGDGKVKIRIEDSGIPFDPLERSDPDVTLSAEDRDIGGLGIFMVKQSMDEVTYSYENGKNVLTFVKYY